MLLYIWSLKGVTSLLRQYYVLKRAFALSVLFPSVNYFIGLLKRCCQTAMPRELLHFSPWLKNTLGYDVFQPVCDPGGGRASKCRLK